MSQKFKSEVELQALNNATTDTDKFLVSDSGVVKYRTGAQILSDLGVSGIYVPYTGATGNVDLGTHTLSSYNLIVNHTSGSGVAASITKGGNGEVLTINKTSGSGNAMSVTGGLTSLVDLTLSSIPNATIDTDRFIVSDSGAIKYRTGAQVLSDIGGQAALTNPITGTGTTNYLSKFTGTTSLGNSQIFDNGTNVLIGTTSNGTSNKVQIQTTGSSRLLSLYNTTANGGAKIEFFDGSSNAAVGNAGGNLLFYANSRDTERMRITSTGNVGIGTSIPSALLHIGQNNTTSDALMRLGVSYSSDRTSRGGITWNDSSNVTSKIYTEFDGTMVSMVFGSLYNSGYNSNPLMTIRGNGNVGIGTSSPSGFLTLSKSGETTFDITDIGGHSKRFFVRNLDKTLGIYNNDTGQQRTQFRLLTGTGATNDRLSLLEAGGKVGIGTTSPNETLTLYKSDRPYLQFVSATTGTAVTDGTALGFTTAAGEFQIRNKEAQAVTISTSDTERMRIASSGNVGIGTTSPVAKLDIGGASGEMIRLADSSTIGNPFISFFQTSTRRSYVQHVDSGDNLTLASEYGGIVLMTGTGGTETEKMRIASNGNVGIGTTNTSSYPFGEKLNVAGNISANGTKIGFGTLDAFTAYGTSAAHYGMSYGSGANPIAVSGFFGVGFFTNGAERMRVENNGNVGIGTSSPSAKLDVNGDALINGLTIGRGGGNNGSNTAIGKGALESNVNGTNNIALGVSANSDQDISGLTAIGVGLNFNTNLQALGGNCLAISQFNNNAVSQQVPHIYAPEPISIDSEVDTDIITFDVDHYAGAIVEYMIRLDDGGDYAVGTVYMGWKTSGSGTLRDVRQIEWIDMSGFEFLQNGNSTLTLRNTTTNTAWIRITVRGIMNN